MGAVIYCCVDIKPWLCLAHQSGASTSSSPLRALRACAYPWVLLLGNDEGYLTLFGMKRTFTGHIIAAIEYWHICQCVLHCGIFKKRKYRPYSQLHI